MKSVFTFLNDYRDTIFYSLCLIATVASVCIFDTRFISFMGAVALFRELLRLISWTHSNEPKAAILVPSVGFVGSILIVFIWVLRCHSSPWTALFFITVSLGQLFLNNRDIIRYFGLKNFCILNAKLYWRELFDWPRKQKPPARRIEKATAAVKKLMQKIADAASPNPLPEIAWHA